MKRIGHGFRPFAHHLRGGQGHDSCLHQAIDGVTLRVPLAARACIKESIDIETICESVQRRERYAFLEPEAAKDETRPVRSGVSASLMPLSAHSDPLLPMMKILG